MTETPRRCWLSLHTLRSVASVFCLTLCVAFVLLWVRSYWRCDVIVSHPDGFWRRWRSWEGGMEFRQAPSDNIDHPRWSILQIPASEWGPRRVITHGMETLANEPETFGFGWGGSNPDHLRVLAPHWLFAVLTTACAVALKPKPRYRFSLVDCLALTTFVAILVALVAWLVRLRG